MKLVIQIPCFNEAENIEDVILSIPREIDGISSVEVILIDDGSTDDSVSIAQKAGVDHVVSHPNNLGLAAAFTSGLKRAQQLEADIIVNTDADGQYRSEEIPTLIKPILDSKADLVIGDRQPGKLEHFSWHKRILQVFGSFVVSRLAHINIPDATSGFRAYSKTAIKRLTIDTNFSHSLETILQAHHKKLKVYSVPINAAHTKRKSRLARSSGHFIFKSLITILRVISYYRPFSLYWTIGSIFLLVGSAPLLRFLWFYFIDSDGRGHIQSLVIGSTLIAMGFTAMLFGILADQTNKNRRILEDINERLHSLENNLHTKDKGES